MNSRNDSPASCPDALAFVQFCEQLRQPLCLAMLRNCTSAFDEAYSAAARLFTTILLQPKLRWGMAWRCLYRGSPCCCVFIECSRLQVPSKIYIVVYCAMRDVDLYVAQYKASYALHSSIEGFFAGLV